MQRRKFSREFKIEAVKLVRERGVSVAQAGRDLDVHENVLRKWVKEFGSDPVQAFPGHGQMKPEQQEIERLRREVSKLKAERDIVNAPPAEAGGFGLRLEAGYDRPSGRLSDNLEVVIWLGWLLVFYVLLPHFIGDVAARSNPVSPIPQMLLPVSPPERLILRQELVGTRIAPAAAALRSCPGSADIGV